MGLPELKAGLRKIAEDRLSAMANPPQQLRNNVQSWLSDLDNAQTVTATAAAGKALLNGVAPSATAGSTAGSLGCCTYFHDGDQSHPYHFTTTESECNLIPSDPQAKFDRSGPCSSTGD